MRLLIILYRNFRVIRKYLKSEKDGSILVLLNVFHFDFIKVFILCLLIKNRIFKFIILWIFPLLSISGFVIPLDVAQVETVTYDYDNK
jgi:hypothetical protein